MSKITKRKVNFAVKEMKGNKNTRCEEAKCRDLGVRVRTVVHFVQ